MGGGNQSPREKMIGMMYLVLTALLALNVSKDILLSFLALESSATKNEAIFAEKNGLVYDKFQVLERDNQTRVKPLRDRALQVEQVAQDLRDHINELKARVITASEKNAKAAANDEAYKEYMEDGKAIPLDKKNEDGKYIITKLDENQENTALIYGADPKIPSEERWTAGELVNMLIEYKEKLISLAPEKDVAVKESIEKSFTFETTKDPETNEDLAWAYQRFYHVPLAAMITQLSTIESQITRSEGEVVTSLISVIDADTYKFNKLEALVLPYSNYVLRGDSISAEIIMGAYDDTNKPEVWVMPNDSKDTIPATEAGFKEYKDRMTQLPLTPEGFGKFRIPTRGMGLGNDYTYSGIIKFKGPNKDIYRSFVTKPFEVAEPSMTVSPTRMNVFYRGVPNPVEISVPGFGKDAIQASCPGHALSRDGTGWTIKPGAGKTAKISVNCKKQDGSNVSMGTKEFRVKRIPDPIPSFGGKRPTDSSMPRVDMQNAAGVRAVMEGFDFDLNVRVVSFDMVFTRDGNVFSKTSRSNKITDEMKQNLRKVGKGQKITLENIKVQMPDGPRVVANITLKAI